MTRTLGTTGYAPTPTRSGNDVAAGYRIVEFGVRLDVDPRALCAKPMFAGQIDQLWFEDSVSDEGDAHRALAMVICRHCPLQQDCHDYAKETRQRDGIWGGVDMGQAARRRRAAEQRASYRRTRKVGADG
jgi:hypothetical protein